MIYYYYPYEDEGTRWYVTTILGLLYVVPMIDKPQIGWLFYKMSDSLAPSILHNATITLEDCAFAPSLPSWVDIAKIGLLTMIALLSRLRHINRNEIAFHPPTFPGAA